MNYLEETWCFCGRVIWNIFFIFISFIGILFVGLLLLKGLSYILPKEWLADAELPFQWLMITLLFLPLPLISAVAYSVLISAFMTYAEGKEWYSNKIRAIIFFGFTPIYIVSAELWCQIPGNLCYI